MAEYRIMDVAYIYNPENILTHENDVGKYYNTIYYDQFYNKFALQSGIECKVGCVRSCIV